MGSYNPSRPGQVLQAGDPLSMFLDIFSGEVMATFQTATVLDDKQRVRTIANGKSASFPAIGRTTASYHTPGAEITGSPINHNERVINVDQLLLSDVFIANIDEAMNHFDIRSPYAVELGQALARQYDEVIGRVIARAARTSATLPADGFGGNSGATASGATEFSDTNAATNAAILTNLIWKAIRKLDEQNIPSMERYIGVKPAQYYLFLANPSSGSAQTPLVVHKDIGGSGGIANGSFTMLGDAMVVKSNNIPSTDLSTSLLASETGGNSYAGDFSKTVALVWQKGAVGTVKLLDISSEAEYLVSRQGTLVVSKYAMGHGVLRPESSVEITTGAITDQDNLTP
jgi:hypothetical protein